MPDTKFFNFPDGNSSVADILAASNNGGMNQMWNNPIWAIVFLAALGNGNLFGNRNNGQTDFISSQLGNAIAGNANAITNLSTQLNCSESQISSAIGNMMTAIGNLANNMGMSTQNLTNAVNTGNMSLANQLCQCCCNMQSTMQGGFGDVQRAIADKAAADQLANCQTKYDLTTAMNNNYLALDNKIDALESSRKDRELAAANAKIAALESQNFTTGVVQQAVAPVIGQLNALGSEVAAIKRCMPATVTLPNNAMTAVPTIWANAVADNFVDKISAALATAGGTTTTPTTNA